MAEKKAVGHAYNIDFLNVVFAASSIFLFLSTIWMVWDDFDREWKNTQRQFTQLEIEVTRAAARADRARRRQARSCTRLQQQLARRAEGDGGQPPAASTRSTTSSRTSTRGSIRANKAAQFAKATYDVDRYAFEGEREGESRRRRRAAEGDRSRGAAAARAEPEVEKVEAERAGAAGRARKVHVGGRAGCRRRSTRSTSSRTGLQRVVDDHRAQPREGLLPQRAAARLHGADADGAPGRHAERRGRRELRARDEDGSVHDLPPGHRSRGATRSIRSRSRTHPNLQAYVGSDSPHPLSTTGCTVCHQGLGGSTSFNDASHYPGNAKQRQEWEEKYHWDEPHMWDYPMLPTQHDRGVVRAVPPPGSLRAERAEADRGVCDLRARGLLRVPQDAGASRTCASRGRS